jgi:hypothetical protein
LAQPYVKSSIIGLCGPRIGGRRSGAALDLGVIRQFGANYADYVGMSAGDFIFVLPFLPYLEANMSRTEELWWRAARRKTSW